MRYIYVMEQTTRVLFAKATDVRLAQIDKDRRWLADELGISQPTLSNRFGGRRNFTTDHLDQIAKALRFDSVETFIAYAMEQAKERQAA